MKPMIELVKRADWQGLRQSFLGTWSKRLEYNCLALRQWMGALESMESVEEDKLRIVMNYLTGTAFRMGKIKGESVSKLRQEITDEWKKRRDF